MPPLSVILVYMFCLAVPGSAALESAALSQSAESPTLSVQPPTQTVTVGDSFTIAVEITGLATPLSAFQFDIAYDAALVKPMVADPGPFLSSTGRAVVCPAYAALDASTLRFACAAAGQAAAPTGDGVLASLTFSALAPGTTSLGLSAAQLAGPGIPPASLAASIQSGEVTIESGAAVTLGEDQSGEGEPNSSVVYWLEVTNTGAFADTFALSVSGASWDSILSADSVGPLAPGASTPFSLTVSIPDVTPGSQDVATVLAESQLDTAITASIQVTTTAGSSNYEIYLPLVTRDS
jgi:hypothetical protein